MTYQHIEVSPVSGALGAEIGGVALERPLPEQTLAEVRRAFLEYQAIFFRGQDLTPAGLKAFGRQFGELDFHEFVAGMTAHPEVISIVKEAGETGRNFGGTWHSDLTFQEKPSLGSALYAVEVPPYGGDTLFANQVMAYQALSDGMKEMLDGLTALHNGATAYGPESIAARGTEAGFKTMAVRLSGTSALMREHPVVRTHPETGRKGLFVNPLFTQHFQGMTREESQPLLQFLFGWGTREEFTCRFRWEPGSLAFWDNRCVLHYALNDYHGHRREMHRITIAGDRPR